VQLVRATTLALEAGINACGPHRPFADIGRTIHKIATQHGCSVNAQFTGHGIGRVFHLPPWILHHSSCSFEGVP
jgi:methionyl aminopeptidase